MVEMKSGYKMTEVGVIPEDWEVKEFNETFLLYLIILCLEII